MSSSTVDFWIAAGASWAITWAASAARSLGQATLLAGVVWLAGRAGQRRSWCAPGVRAWLWWLVCLKLCAAFLFVPPVALRVLPAENALATARRVANGTGTNAAVSGGGSGPSALADTPVAATAARRQTAAPSETRQAPLLALAALLLFCVWLAGVAAGAVSAARGIGRLRRVLAGARPLPSDDPLLQQARQVAAEMGLNAPPNVMVSEAFDGAPLVAGLRRPTIMLPAGLLSGLSPDEQRLVLAHEMAHLRRGDLWLAGVPALARTLGWFFPPVYLACRQWAGAREAACDLLALRATGASPGRYCRLLLAVVARDTGRARGPLAAAAAAAVLGATTDFHTLHERLRLLRALSHGNQGRPERRRVLSWIVGLVSGAVLLAALAPLFVPWRLAPRRRALPAAKVAAAAAPVAADGANTLAPAPADVADVPIADLRAGGDDKKRYLLIGGGAPKTKTPPGGYRLLVVLPGGDGSADFSPFVRRVWKRALGPNYLVAELVAPRWDARQMNEVVWPTTTNPWPGMVFGTEEFVAAVVRDVGRQYRVDPRYTFALGWASGGPPVYAASLRPAGPLSGSFVAMSVFSPSWLPPLKNARGHAYFVLHPSGAPIVPPRVAARAVKTLRANGARAELVFYDGGYGWRGDVYAQIRRGVAWLEKNHVVQ